MANSLTGRVTVNAAIDFINTLDIGQSEYPMKFGKNYAFTSGTGENQANQLFSDTRTLAASTSEDLDLAGGLADVFGNTITFTKVKALIVSADSGNTNLVHVGGQATNGVTAFYGATADFILVRPGGTIALIAPDATGYAITAGTADLLKLANSGGGSSVTYTIIIVGTV